MKFTATNPPLLFSLSWRSLLGSLTERPVVSKRLVVPAGAFLLLYLPLPLLHQFIFCLTAGCTDKKLTRTAFLRFVSTHHGSSWLHQLTYTQDMSSACLGGASSGSGSGGGGGDPPFKFPEAPELPQDAKDINLDFVLSLLESLEKGLSVSSKKQNEAGDEVRGVLPFRVVVVVSAEPRESSALSILLYCCCMFSIKMTRARSLRRDA